MLSRRAILALPLSAFAAPALDEYDPASIQEGAELKIPAKDAAAATVSVPVRAHG